MKTPLVLASVFFAACQGSISDAGGREGAGAGPSPGFIEESGPAASGLRRLTNAEYINTIRDLFGDEVDAGAFLPTETRSPFDNSYAAQLVSAALIAGTETLAADISERLVADPDRRQAIVGCSPSTSSDTACFREFVARFGRRALRRPLSADEVDTYASLIQVATDTDDFYSAVGAAVSAMLQDPRFLYRVEIGTPVPSAPGLFRLDDWEVASRLSYLLWGTTPSDELLDLAQAGGLRTPEQVRDAALPMLDDPRAPAQAQRFFAMWLGYERLPGDEALSNAMHRESAELIDRVIFEERRPWQELLLSEETYLTAELAEHYDLPHSGGADPEWVRYPGERRGLLSHGTFLSLGQFGGDTSPTQRGMAIRDRLLCDPIPPPPPSVDNAAIAEAPDAVACKQDVYIQHARPACAGCHSQMDPIGFGLENFDNYGRFRTHDEGKPECAIEGVGDLGGVQFSGPAELAERGLESGMIDQCLIEQMHRFASGRANLDASDRARVEALAREVGDTGFRYDELLLSIVSAESFGYRRVDESEGQ